MPLIFSKPSSQSHRYEPCKLVQAVEHGDNSAHSSISNFVVVFEFNLVGKKKKIESNPTEASGAIGAESFRADAFIRA